MTEAFVLGNGTSRKTLDLSRLNTHGKIYGCNALYREYAPNVLVAADKSISEQIQHSGYALNHRFYTRRPLPNLGGLRIPDPYWGYSSGQIALSLACLDNHNTVYLLGFDLGSTADKFNNIYADTEFYKRSTDKPTYSGNWIRQILQISNNFPKCMIVRVTGAESATIKDFNNISNISSLPLETFKRAFWL
jgi:hypothetical protein